MAHSPSDVAKSREDLTLAITNEIAIYRGYIKALENVLNAMRSIAPAPAMELRPENVEPVHGFVRELADKVNGRAGAQVQA